MTASLAPALLLAATASAAAAQCPTVTDMAAGVQFETSAGEHETFRQTNPTLVEALLDFGAGDASRTLLAKGIYLLEVVDIHDGVPQGDTRTTFSYPVGHAEMPDPAPGGTWSVTAATLHDGRIDSEAQDYSFGAIDSRDYGGCSYAMMEITIRYPNEDDPLRRDVLHYLPDLGLSYLAEYHDKDGSDVYDYIKIEPVK